MKILSIVGARPQFIKAFAVSKALRARHQEELIHTGQHYDYVMSEVFFKELGIPAPRYNLGIGSGKHGQQTGAMLAAIEDILLQECPDSVLVYGDTNSTLAGALAATKLHIPVVHVEAGLRSLNRAMPEEINRVLTDHCSHILFCPTQTAVENLRREGIQQNVFLTGDVMFDALLLILPHIDETAVLQHFGLQAKDYVLATIHRASNTDERGNIERVLDCFSAVDWPIIFPIHPRTAATIQMYELVFPPNVKAVEPVTYIQMLALERNARAVLTDSGGVQKEAFLLRTPCITMRDETEWVETVNAGWNTLVGLDSTRVTAALAQSPPPEQPPPLFGDGTAAQQIAQIMEQVFA